MAKIYMDRDVLFEAMRRIMEMHECARAIDPEAIAVMVQRSKGDPTYSLGVACAFRMLAGDNWYMFCDIYDTTSDKSKSLTDEQHSCCVKELQLFWNRVGRSGKVEEFESAAKWYLRIKEAA